jgi:hypothetical protein
VTEKDQNALNATQMRIALWMKYAQKERAVIQKQDAPRIMTAEAKQSMMLVSMECVLLAKLIAIVDRMKDVLQGR